MPNYTKGEERFNFKHGMKSKNNRLYNVYFNMKKRCYSKKSQFFHDYGGRGIRVCNEWINNPEIFFKWALANGYKNSLHIDRINNDGNYEPSNCRFVTACINASNKRKYKNNTTGYVGVSKNGINYRSRIRVENKLITIGNYNTPKQASNARNKYIDDNNLPHLKNR